MKFASYLTDKCLLKRPGFHSKINLAIRCLTIEFFNEGFMHFFYYFFEQFMDSLTNTNPYSDPIKEEFENLKQRKTIRKETVKKLMDFKQVTEIIEMDIRLFDLSLKIPDRPKSKSFLLLYMQEFIVTQSISL